jgi:hypothetical protein
MLHYIHRYVGICSVASAILKARDSSKIKAERLFDSQGSPFLHS